MRLMFVIAGVALAGSVLMPTMVQARVGAEVQQAASSQPSARQLELTRQYINLLMTDQLEGAIREMVGDEMANDTSAPALPAEDRRFILDLTAEMTTDMVPLMVQEMVPVYAAVFTEEELMALIAFYDNPLGRSIADKSIIVMPEANRAIMSVVPQMLEKMALRMCQHYQCTPEELEEMRRGMREGFETGSGESVAAAPRRK
ncbi:MAG: DUF2059 domain-containing protein [Brevundimonas sp.]|uniref:DUF2059 domain-containing protein n=1 Tax=Brevundimonas sp. TaxID=1871086 RepID=UPI001A23496C|nr:DUF2059 domain-containing protein [Brevundimonas sp.]MBJ7447210.1 DUF2059 domain-containing protein [Brevundimonas sp.]